MPRPWRTGIFMIAVLVVLAGCDARASATGASTMATTPRTSTSAVAVAPSASTSTVYDSCAPYMRAAPGAVQAGDLFLDTTPEIGAILYQLPDGTPLNPLAVPARLQDGTFTGWPVSTLATNAVYVRVCNTSAMTPHTLQALSVKLAGFTPYDAQLSAWDFCAGFYTRQLGSQTQNCDRGSVEPDLSAEAGFPPDARPGMVLAAVPAGTTGPVGAEPFSLAVPPGHFVYIRVSLTPPPATGTYTFAASAMIDSANTPYTGAISIVFAPIAHQWSGVGCQTPTMLSQIPDSAPTQPYICPS